MDSALRRGEACLASPLPYLLIVEGLEFVVKHIVDRRDLPAAEKIPRIEIVGLDALFRMRERTTKIQSQVRGEAREIARQPLAAQHLRRDASIAPAVALDVLHRQDAGLLDG